MIKPNDLFMKVNDSIVTCDHVSPGHIRILMISDLGPGRHEDIADLGHHGRPHSDTCVPSEDSMRWES